MSDYRHRVNVITSGGALVRSLVFDDYYEAVDAAFNIASGNPKYDPDQITIDYLVFNNLISTVKLTDIKQHDKITAYLLNIARKAQVTDDLELVVDSLIIADLWNHKAIPSAQIEYRIVYSDFKVIVIIEGYHYGFHMED